MGLISYMNWFTGCAVFIALASFIWQAFVLLRRLNRVTVMLAGLLALESSIQRTANSAPPKVAVGYGACTDMQINATEFLQYSSDFVRKVGPEFTVDKINDERELLQTFAYYFQNGAAAERVMPNRTLFRQLIKRAKTKFREQINWYMGGNAPLMAMRFLTEGAEVLLGAHMSTKLRALLPETIHLAGDEISEDDIHIILEYKAGDRWGPYVAPRANRYILHSDLSNPRLQSVEKLMHALKTFQPNLVVISGLQMMDSYQFAPGIREARLKQVQRQLRLQNRDTLQHFEMASYVELNLLQQLRKYVLPYVDSIGMNEQELENLKHVLLDGRTTLATDWNPRVAATLDQMRLVFSILAEDYFHNSYKEPQRRPVTRIHVHTLAYQAILTVTGSKWNNTQAAAAKAALTAHRYVCKSKYVNPEAANLVLDDSFATSAVGDAPRVKIDAENVVPCWNEEVALEEITPNVEIEICVAPVLVCRVAKKTAGAGDNISASGLAGHL